MNFVLPLPKVAKANTQTKLLPSALCPFPSFKLTPKRHGTFANKSCDQ